MTQRHTHTSWASTVPDLMGEGTSQAKVEIPLERSTPLASSANLPELPSHSREASLAHAHRPEAIERLSLGQWTREGLRAALLRAPRHGQAQPTPLQLCVVVAVCSLLLLALARAEVPGPAEWNLYGWFAPWGSGLVALWLAWWAMEPAPSSPPESGAAAAGAGKVAAWVVRSSIGGLLPMALAQMLVVSAMHRPGWWAGEWAGLLFWGVWAALLGWAVVVAVAVLAPRVRSKFRSAVFAAGAAALVVGAGWLFPERPWLPPRFEAPSLVLQPALIEAQLAVLPAQLDALAAERPGVVDVYGVVYAPFAGEEVFRRESQMVGEVLESRFEARGRVVQLLNHAQTARTHAWATPQNLERAIAGIAQRMDRDNDLLVVYMTSHGARDHALAAHHPPLAVDAATPEHLRAVLDAAGIRHRVIAVSACYSGGWIAPLATATSLVMTAADAHHTSYGCGTRSELTFFGRAVFDEQLRRTHSFTQAFEQAVPLIAQREKEAGKDDGFSNPQLEVGDGMRAYLGQLEQRLSGRGHALATEAAAAPDLLPTLQPAEAGR